MSKSNIIKLYMSAEESKRWNKKRHADETTDENKKRNQEAPKAIIQKIVGDETKIQEYDIVSKMFTYEEADVLVILDKNKNPWYKGIDICKILQYVKPRNAISTHVDIKYKKSLADMTPEIQASIKLDKKTLFINNSGIFQLISRSKKPEAIKLWEFITETILPELFSKGSYTMPPNKSDIERLKKSFYDENMLSDWKNKNCVYLSYIGKIKGNYHLNLDRVQIFRVEN